MNLQGKIRDLMNERGWTVYRLAKESGVSWSTLRHMFERNTEPTMPTIEAICKGLGISLEALLLGDQYVVLSDDQKLLLNQWDMLSTTNKHIVMELIRSLNKE